MRSVGVARRAQVIAVAVMVVFGACSGGGPSRHVAVSRPRRATVRPPAPPAEPTTTNVYAADGAGMLAPAAQGVPARVYVPNSDDASVDVIDPATFKVIGHFPSGRNPQHVVPAWDLQTLYVNNDLGNSLTPIDPRTAKPKANIPVDDPYNLYFTPDGKAAIVVAEARRSLDFREPHTFGLIKRVPVMCRGPNHMDFAADDSYLIGACEFSGQLFKLDLHTMEIVGYIKVGGAPQDVKLEPAGKVFFVADMRAGGVHEIDGASFTQIGFLPTGPEAHGLYVSRDSRSLYVSNRGGPKNRGSVSVVDFGTRKVVATWEIPGGGTPDMGGVSADGKVFWLSGRRSREIYAFDTDTGKVLARIRVGPGPHGLCVWPQPGRYSLGHTGNMR